MSAMARRLASLLTVLLLAGALTAAAARADGDPASDVLLGQNVFYPYTPAVPASVQASLNAATAKARRAGLPIKVALIASPVDLGVIPELFGKPQSYADFLDKEISFEQVQPLLVVMAAGYGAQGVPAAVARAVKTLAPPAGRTSTDLADAAITAVGRLAAASGHPISSVAGGSSGGGGSSAPILIVLVVAAVLVAGAVIALRRRQANPGAAR
jgi:hypothetical protein